MTATGAGGLRRPPLFVRAVERLSRGCGAAAAVLLAAMAVLMLAEVAARNFAGRSLYVTWEFSAYAMAGVFFLGAAYTLQSAGHVRVAVLLELLGARAVRWLEVAVTAFALVVIGYLAYALFGLTARSYAGDVRSWTGYRVPLFLPQLALALGAALLALQLAARLTRLLLGLPPEVGPADADPALADGT